MSKEMIKVDNLSKLYKLYKKPVDRLYESLGIKAGTKPTDFYALKNISFVVNQGETIGIIGTNGSGKSTLLKIITGVLNQSQGTIDVNGKVSALLELGAGFNYEYTGLENIYLNGMMLGFSREEMDVKLDQILDFADIGEFIHQPVKSYSSGMFARLAFAVAINVEPEILIVDEALSVGDMKFQIKCMNRMKEMMLGGTTVLFVSHDTNAIRRFCTRTIWLKNGELVADGDTNYVIDRYCEYLKLKELGREDEAFNIKETARPIVSSPSNIAEITSFKILNSKNEESQHFMFDEYMKIEIKYNVSEEVESPVIGVALLGIDDDYVCGLNTLLDEYKIPWEMGENTLVLEYPNGLRVIGGKYYFNTAIFDQTATVNIQYISKIKEIEIYAKYIGEGRLILNHTWKG